MLQFCTFLLLLAVSSRTLTQDSNYILHEKRELALRDVVSRRRLDSDIILPMRIGLKSNNDAISNAETWVTAVSDPDSPLYGHFWSPEQVIEAFKPSNESIIAVKSWLLEHGVAQLTHSDNKQWFAFDAPSAQAEKMLKTEFFAHWRADGTVTAACDEYHLPGEILEHVDYVTPGIKGSDITRQSEEKIGGVIATPARPRDIQGNHKAVNSRDLTAIDSPEDLQNCSRLVTPACIRALYNFAAPNPDTPVSKENNLGIFAAYDLNIDKPLARFLETLTSIPPDSKPNYFRIDGAGELPPGSSAPSSSYETELDVECAWPIVYPQNISIFQAPRPPKSSRSQLDFYGDFLDAIDGSYCQGSGAQRQCGVFEPTNVLSLSYGSLEFEFPARWRQRQCNEYLKLGLQGVSVFVCSQDYGASLVDPKIAEKSSSLSNRPFECKFKPGKNVFMPVFPASCPWVTSVGATQIPKGKTVYDPEEAAELLAHDDNNKAYTQFSSGGGYSITFPAPKYQQAATKHYFDTANIHWPYFTDGKYENSTGAYNRDGRGVPDIAAVGNHIAAITKISPKHVSGESGTSAATPIVAALFNRIVEERLRAGKSGRLGFVNPTLYKHPDVFQDIVTGGNDVNNYCLKQTAFECAVGWDPVTGLGTPDYPKLLKLFMSLP